MNQAFDPLNLLILAVAVVIFFRLKSVLGTRTGHERRYDPFGTSAKTEKTATPPADDNVIPLPGRDADATAADAESGRSWDGIADADSPLAKGLDDIVQADPSFSVAEFLEGAKVAYEMIVTAFAEGDKKSLKNLLARDVYSGFSAAIDAREQAGETLETRFVGIEENELSAAELVGRKAQVTVRFVSDMITVTRDSEGRIVDGDPKQIREVTDIWTFERDVTSRDPNWKLIATEDTE